MPSVTCAADIAASALEQGPGRGPRGPGHIVDPGPCDADGASLMRREGDEEGQEEPASRSLPAGRQVGFSQTTRIQPYALRKVVSCGFTQKFTDACVEVRSAEETASDHHRCLCVCVCVCDLRSSPARQPLPPLLSFPSLPLRSSHGTFSPTCERSCTNGYRRVVASGRVCVCVHSGEQGVDFVGTDVCIYPASFSPFSVVPRAPLADARDLFFPPLYLLMCSARVCRGVCAAASHFRHPCPSSRRLCHRALLCSEPWLP